MGKEYTEQEAAKILAKSMWKSVKKAIGKNPVTDVLDANMTREANPTTVPADKESVMNKAPSEKVVANKEGVSTPSPKAKKLKGFMAKRQEKQENKKKA